jgi:predicted RND superfamily exporter protein
LSLSFFLWLEGTAISEWVRGSPSLWAFPFILYLHTLGLALIAGLSTAVAFGIIAMPASVQRWPMFSLFPLMWVGLAINAASGILLLLAYPAKALTNPVFYIKLVAIAIAVVIVHRLEGQFASRAAVTAGTGNSVSTTLDTEKLRRAAFALIGLWLIATLTGRLLAYTHSILLASLSQFT